MHGTMMMFLFAVPAVEALGVLLLPQMLGARDLPFPRLSAFAFWAYLDRRPRLLLDDLLRPRARRRLVHVSAADADTHIRPAINADFWLLGIGFIEISAIAGAIEIIVGMLRTRAAGHVARQDADLRLVHADLRGDDRLRLPGRDPRHHAAGDWSAPSAGRSSMRPRAATRCCGSTCSGSSAIRRSTSSSCRRPASCR